MQITIVAGARPNFMKVAPIIKALESAKSTGRDVSWRLVHTGQHYDKKMSGDFFEQLSIPLPDVNLEVGGGTQAEQTAGVLVGFERELLAHRPDVVLVVGDVNSTMACTISAKKLAVPVVHVEAGIRSGDMTMPEEINRIVTDSICDHFFTTSEFANQLLRKSGIGAERIHFVGNTMIDTLMQNLNRLRRPEIWNLCGLERDKYFLVTLHRPANVDIADNLARLLNMIIAGTAGFPVIFPVHPRTRKTLENENVNDERLFQTEPLGYLEFIYLLKHARAIITDSGGITEEATVLGIPCMTMRNTTERPETITVGTNELVGTDAETLPRHLHNLSLGLWKKGAIPELWDGKTSERIVQKLINIYE